MAATNNFDVQTTLTIGTDVDLTVCRAITAAKEGKRTIVISRSQITKLQHETLRKMRSGHRILRRMMFVVPASRYDLLKLMSELHTWGESVPHQLILDGVMDNLKNPELVCAVAVDTIRACSVVLNCACRLLVSVDSQYYDKYPENVQFMAAHYFDRLVSIVDSVQ